MIGDLTFVILGACEGTLSCSTCHIIFKPEEMAALNLDEPSDEELYVGLSLWPGKNVSLQKYYFVHFACLTGLVYWVNTNDLS